MTTKTLYKSYIIEESQLAEEPYYVPVGDEVELFEAAYREKLPLIFKGPTGCGKTRFVEYMSYKLGVELRKNSKRTDDSDAVNLPLVTIACHEDLTSSDLVGRYLLEGDQTVWIDGPLTRAVKAGGSSNHTNMDYVTIASTGNATDFGDLFKPMREFAGCSNVTRGVFGGGYAANSSGHDTMQYITIATTGNSTDFGNASSVWTANGCGNGTRGTWMGGYNGGATPNTQIDYVTLATTSNTSDFGDLSYSAYAPGGAVGNSPRDDDRGIYMGGDSPTYGGSQTLSMSYITVSTTGNGQDFGDLASQAYISGAQNNASRGVQCGTGSSNVMQYFAIGTLGNAQDFGDLLSGASGFTAMGNSSGD